LVHSSTFVPHENRTHSMLKSITGPYRFPGRLQGL
jgi:hypothetical protein